MTRTKVGVWAVHTLLLGLALGLLLALVAVLVVPLGAALWKLAAALMGVGTERAQLEAQRVTIAAVELYHEIGGDMPGFEDFEWDLKILPLYR